jgi:solute carrier family 25 carnitine/acylcarnitine transporter 20/29
MVLQVGFKCAEDEDDLTRFDSSDIEFDEFCHILLNDITLQKRLAAFQTNWSTVYRPGYLKTPIHKKRKLSALEDFLSGSFAGIVTTIVGHRTSQHLLLFCACVCAILIFFCGSAFDTVKVRLQTQSLTLPTASSTAVEPKGALARSSMWQAIKQGGLYKGVWSPMFSIPLVNAIVFATYEQCKKMLLRHKDQSSTLSEGQLAFCGGIAGLASCSVVSPVELIRTRLQIQGSTGNPQYRGSLDCAKQILRTEGIRGLGRGMFATIARDVPSYVAQFYVYEGLKRALTPEGQSVENLPTKYLLLAGGLGGTAGWLVSYPIDNIKSNLQVAPPGTYKRHSWIPDGGLIDCFRRTVQQRSAAALFTGLVPCLLRAFPVNACAYATYEFSSKFFAEKRLFD